ncbi:uncharacterized protein BDV14DRAFT_197944 [Aspergillus stella-maris]|uniref:uncharacterized protein n=1 Tax=Aspergillus stella-maris TaxID=1810926 RepID=UPI003CCCF44F
MKPTLSGFAAFLPLALVAGSTASRNSTESAICYNLDGSEANDDVPCGTGDVVNCCNSGDICMSNGLCMQQGERGGTLARGSCTDQSWGSRCYAPCSEYNRSSGISIVHIRFDDEPEYCCGDATSTQDDDDDYDDDDDDEDEDEDDEPEITCLYDDPFIIPFGTVIPGVAGLSNHTLPVTSDTSDSTTSNSDSRISTGLAIALGIGLPLGLASMGIVLWAVWERRRRYLRVHYGEETVRTGMEMGMGKIDTTSRTRLTSLHDLYGPVPSYASSGSRRGTLNVSGISLPRPPPVESTPWPTPASPLSSYSVTFADPRDSLHVSPLAPRYGVQTGHERGCTGDDDGDR